MLQKALVKSRFTDEITESWEGVLHPHTPCKLRPCFLLSDYLMEFLSLKISFPKLCVSRFMVYNLWHKNDISAVMMHNLHTVVPCIDDYLLKIKIRLSPPPTHTLGPTASVLPTQIP